MKIYWILIILAVICALSADKIDKAVNADNKLRYVLWVFCGGICLISIIGIAANLLSI